MVFYTFWGWNTLITYYGTQTGLYFHNLESTIQMIASFISVFVIFQILKILLIKVENLSNSFQVIAHFTVLLVLTETVLLLHTLANTGHYLTSVFLLCFGVLKIVFKATHILDILSELFTLIYKNL